MTIRPRWMRIGAAVLVIVIALVALWRARSRPVIFPPPAQATVSASVSRADFVGAQRCARCHAREYAAWSGSTHGRAGGSPKERAIAPFNGAPIRFRDATVVPRVSRGVYEFVVQQPGEDPRVLRIDGVVGGGHIYGGGTQGYVSAYADGTMRFLPFEWSRQARAWFCNTNSRSGRGWAPITADMLLEECGDWPPTRVLGDNPRFANCQSCHASQATLVLDTIARRYDTRLASLEINCESCHGPGRRHVTLAERGELAKSSDIGMRSLVTLEKDAALRVCYQCHAVKDQLHAGYLSGDSLTAFYSLLLPLLGDRPLTPDGRVRTFAYQESHQFSDCYLSGGMTCTSCHDPHDQRYRDVNGVALSSRFDDRQCTSCHVSKADRAASHSHHPATVTCTACHMPFRQEPETRPLNARVARSAVIPYTRSDHTISIPRPAVDASFGLASACSSCHTDMSVADQERAVRAWWGTLKPHLADSARNRYATFAGMARMLEQDVRVDAPLDEDVRRRARTLARESDVDVRALALATLHLAEGTDRGMRRELTRALRDAAPHDFGLRARWAIALGYMADRFASSGNLADARVAYSRALEVQPGNARLLLNLANAQRDAGDLTTAVATYQRSVALDRNAPLAWVNFGIALGAIGDTAAAITAFNNAATLDSSEALAWYNLANVHFVRHDLGRARELYARAAALDPSMTPAHFQLARIALLAHDERGALKNLRRGLAFDSSDASARDLAADLTRRLGGMPGSH